MLKMAFRVTVMPNIKSAIKRVRTTENAEARNISQNAMRTAVKMLKQQSTIMLITKLN